MLGQLALDDETKRFIAVAAAVVVVATALAMTLPSGAQAGVLLDRSVQVYVEPGKIAVHVSVWLPTTYYYYYYYYTAGGVPVKAIVAVEAGDPPVMVASTVLDMVATSSPATGWANFTGLAAGEYRVKVYFWNDLLSVLLPSGSPWDVLAERFIQLVSVP